MCRAVQFVHGGRQRQARFVHRGARLPVSSRRGAQVLLLPWGRRPRESGALPAGGWAKLTHIQAGVWDRYAPRPVQIPVSGFAERDMADQEQWFEVTRGQCIQGCLVRHHKEMRVYVVTLDCAPDESTFFRWPRLVVQGERMTDSRPASLGGPEANREQPLGSRPRSHRNQ